jgi:hypothetical protein
LKKKCTPKTKQGFSGCIFNDLIFARDIWVFGKTESNLRRFFYDLLFAQPGNKVAVAE